MRTTLNKILALSIVIITVIGMLLSLFFLVQIWRFRPPVTEKLQSAAKQTSAILGTTEKGLELIDQVVLNVYSSTITLEDSADAFAQTMQTSTQFFGSASTFLGEGLINTITNTQTAIDSAKTSAVVIDNILTTLSNIPLIGIKYNPSRPLSVALGEVSDSLDPLQGTLMGFETNLKATQTNMQEFKDQILVLKQNIVTINKNLKSAQVVIDNYQTQLKSLQSWMNKAIISLPGWITTICWIMTFFIMWLVLIQIAILLQAINVLNGENNNVVEIRDQEIPPV
jgi:hypothetical protein